MTGFGADLGRLTADGAMWFGHGPAPDGPDVATQINRLIDKALEDEAAKAPPPKALGMSQLGDKCLRKVAYDWHNAKRGQRPKFSGELLRIFRQGHRIEDEVVADLRLAGFSIINLNPETGRQYGFGAVWDEEKKTYLYKGKYDGRVIGGPTSAIQYPCLLEIKSMNADNYKKCVENGVKISHFKYFVQLNGYNYRSGLHANPCWFICVNKDNSKYHHEFVPFDAETFNKYEARAAQLLNSAAPEDFPREGFGPDKFPCLYCQHKERCYAEPEPQRTVVAAPEWMR